MMYESMIYDNFIIWLEANKQELNKHDVVNEPVHFQSHIKSCQQDSKEFLLRMKSFLEKNIQNAGICLYSENRRFYLSVVNIVLEEIHGVISEDIPF